MQKNVFSKETNYGKMQKGDDTFLFALGLFSAGWLVFLF